MTVIRSIQKTLKSAGRCYSIQASPVQTPVSNSDLLPFEIFKQPKVVVPAFEFQRWAGNGFSQYVYRVMVEKEYTKEGFLNGTNQAIDLSAQLIRARNWGRLRNIMTEKCVERVSESSSRISDEMLNKKLNFSYENGDVVHSFLHSTILSGQNAFKMSENSSFLFCGTIVSFINVSGSPLPPMSVSRAAANKDKLVVANMTIGRHVKPVGPWFITNINFFDYPVET